MNLHEKLDNIQHEIKELNQNRLDLIEKNLHLIVNARLIAEQLGKLDNNPIHQKHGPVKVWEYDNLTITLQTVCGKYLQKIGDYERRDNVLIKLGNHVVCWYAFTNSDNPYCQDDQIFIVGQWTKTIINYVDQANEIFLLQQIKESQKELDELKLKMLVGVDL